MTEQLITMILSMENIIVFAYARNSESLYKLAVVLTTLHCSYNFTRQLATYTVTYTRQFLRSFGEYICIKQWFNL